LRRSTNPVGSPISGREIMAEGQRSEVEVFSDEDLKEFRREDIDNATASIYVKTGIGKRYHMLVRPQEGRPVLIAVHL
jgi:hypothetical protein